MHVHSLQLPDRRFQGKARRKPARFCLVRKEY